MGGIHKWGKGFSRWPKFLLRIQSKKQKMAGNRKYELDHIMFYACTREWDGRKIEDINWMLKVDFRKWGLLGWGLSGKVAYDSWETSKLNPD